MIEKLSSTTIKGLGRSSRDWRLGTGERETRARDLEMMSRWREKNLSYLLITGRDYIYTLIHDRGKLSSGRVQADTGTRKAGRI